MLSAFKSAATNINRCSSYTVAMFNTETCKLITTAYSITFVKRAKRISSSDFARMEQVAEQKQRKLFEQNSYDNAADQ